MDDDGDMAEMYLTEKKQRREAFANNDMYDQSHNSINDRFGSKSAPVSPVGSSTGVHRLQRALSSVSSSKHGSLLSSTSGGENIDQLEMLLEAYFVVSDNTLNKLLSVREAVSLRYSIYSIHHPYYFSHLVSDSRIHLWLLMIKHSLMIKLMCQSTSRSIEITWVFGIFHFSFPINLSYAILKMQILI